MPSLTTTTSQLSQNMLHSTQIANTTVNSSLHMPENRNNSVNLNDLDDVGLFSDLYADTPSFRDNINTLSNSNGIDQISERENNNFFYEFQNINDVSTQNSSLSIATTENESTKPNVKLVTQEDESPPPSSNYSPSTRINQDINDELSLTATSISPTVVVTTSNRQSPRIPQRGISSLFHWNRQT